LPKKLGIREGARVYVAGAPEGFGALLAPLPAGVERLGRAGAAMDVVLLFVTEERDLRSRFPKLAAGLVPPGRLWVAWPKKASSYASELDFDTVQRIGLDAGWWTTRAHRSPKTSRASSSSLASRTAHAEGG
jgi:hypothetical protein